MRKLKRLDNLVKWSILWGAMCLLAFLPPNLLYLCQGQGQGQLEPGGSGGGSESQGPQQQQGTVPVPVQSQQREGRARDYVSTSLDLVSTNLYCCI
jgi:hypothetical protein